MRVSMVRGVSVVPVVERVLQVAIVWVAAYLAWLVVSPVLLYYTNVLNVLPDFTRPMLAAAPSIQAPLAMPAHIHGYDPNMFGEEGAYAELTARTVDVDLLSLSTGDRALYVVGPLLLGALALAGLVLLHRMVRDTARGETFIHANARRMTILGALVIAGTPAGVIGDTCRQVLLERSQVAAFVNPAVTLHLWPVVIGLVVAVLGEVFRQGARLREDVEGLV